MVGKKSVFECRVCYFSSEIVYQLGRYLLQFSSVVTPAIHLLRAITRFDRPQTPLRTAIINNNIIPTRLSALSVHIYLPMCVYATRRPFRYIIIIIILVSNCLHEGPARRVWATTKVSERVNGGGRVEVNIYNTSLVKSRTTPSSRTVWFFSGASLCILL